ncbi:hypothetical protein RUND412_000836 [Rhizina undulata]
MSASPTKAPSYGDYDTHQLAELCSYHELSVWGTKAELILRLQADDFRHKRPILRWEDLNQLNFLTVYPEVTVGAPIAAETSGAKADIKVSGPPISANAFAVHVTNVNEDGMAGVVEKTTAAIPVSAHGTELDLEMTGMTGLVGNVVDAGHAQVDVEMGREFGAGQGDITGLSADAKSTVMDIGDGPAAEIGTAPTYKNENVDVGTA